MTFDMSPKWTNSEGASNRVKELLEHAGLPLELQVASICEEFIQGKTNQEGVPLSDLANVLESRITTEKVIYSQSNKEGEYREIDQQVFFYRELTITQRLALGIGLHISIECKFRKDVEHFAFPLFDHSLHRRFPIHSYLLKGSSLLYSLTPTLDQLEEYPKSSITSLEIKTARPRLVSSKKISSTTQFPFSMTTSSTTWQ